MGTQLTAAEQRRKVAINDDVIQALTTVIYALELDDPGTAAAAARQALSTMRQIVSELSDADGSLVLEPAALRRGQAPPVVVLP